MTSQDYGTLEKSPVDEGDALNGGFGAYQITIMIAIQLVICQFAGNVAFMSFATYLPDVQCGTDKGVLLQTHNLSHTSPQFCKTYEAGSCTHVQVGLTP